MCWISHLTFTSLIEYLKQVSVKLPFWNGEHNQQWRKQSDLVLMDYWKRLVIVGAILNFETEGLIIDEVIIQQTVAGRFKWSKRNESIESEVVERVKRQWISTIRNWIGWCKRIRGKFLRRVTKRVLLKSRRLNGIWYFGDTFWEVTGHQRPLIHFDKRQRYPADRASLSSVAPLPHRDLSWPVVTCRDLSGPWLDCYHHLYLHLHR